MYCVQFLERFPVVQLLKLSFKRSRKHFPDTLLVFVLLALQSLSKQSSLEDVVKTLAPALLAELAKLKASSSSYTGVKPSSASAASSSSSTAKKDLTKRPSVQKNVPKSKVGVSFSFLSLKS